MPALKAMPTQAFCAVETCAYRDCIATYTNQMRYGDIVIPGSPLSTVPAECRPQIQVMQSCEVQFILLTTPFVDWPAEIRQPRVVRTPCSTSDYLPTIPVGKFGEPDDVAHVTSFFLDAKSSFVTGQVLYVCGGLTVGASVWRRIRKEERSLREHFGDEYLAWRARTKYLIPFVL